MTETAKCTLCAREESPGLYTGCMVKDGHAPDWDCDNGNLTRKEQMMTDQILIEIDIGEYASVGIPSAYIRFRIRKHKLFAYRAAPLNDQFGSCSRRFVEPACGRSRSLIAALRMSRR